MSYYGATGTRRVYVDTSQPLWGLGSDPTPGTTARAQFNLAQQHPGLIGPMMNLGNRAAVEDAFKNGVVCLGGDPPPQYTKRILARDALQHWAATGYWVVLRNHSGEPMQLCTELTMTPEPGWPLYGWTAYRMSKSSLSQILGDPNAYVFMGPDDAFGEIGSQNKMTLADIAGTTHVPPVPVPPVPVPPPSPPQQAGSGFLWPILLFGGVLAAAYYFGSRDSEYEFEPNSWRC